jgi:hypothetical protein
MIQFNGNLANGKNMGHEKEVVETRCLIGFKDGEFRELASVRWYMGRRPSSSIIYCSIWINCNDKETHTAGHGRASGSGYCKLSSSFAHALESAGIKTDIELDGRGMSTVDDFLTELGHTLGFELNHISRG